MACVVPAVGNNVLAQRAQCRKFFCGIVHQRCHTENNHRPIIHRVIEDGAGEHQSIEQRDRDANRNSAIEVAQHTAGGRAVDVKHVAVASVGSGDDERLSVGDEADMAEKGFVEDLVDDFAVVDSPLRFTHYAGACCWSGIAGLQTAGF